MLSSYQLILINRERKFFPLSLRPLLYEASFDQVLHLSLCLRTQDAECTDQVSERVDVRQRLHSVDKLGNVPPMIAVNFLTK